MKRAALSLKRAAIYRRRSTGKQAISLETQLESCEEYIAKHDLVVSAEHCFTDTKTGGALHRVELDRLLSAARRGEFDIVVTYCLDRVMRDADYLGWLKTELRNCSVKLVYSSKEYGSGMAGQIMESVDSAYAEEERKRIGKRTREALETMVTLGQVPAKGPSPFGYAKERLVIHEKSGPRLESTGRLVVVEEEAEIVTRIYEWAAAGESAHGIAKRLNGEGTPPPSQAPGKKYRRQENPRDLWWPCTIWAMLRDSTYRGEWVGRKVRSTRCDEDRRDDDPEWEARPPDEWVSVEVPAIVESDLWHAAQATLSSRRGAARTRNAARPCLLRGLVVCSRCGKSLNPDWHASGTLAYRCGSRNTPEGACGAPMVPGERLETETWRLVSEYLSDPAKLAHDLEQEAAAGPDPALSEKLARVKNERAEVVGQQERLLEETLKGRFPEAILNQKADALNRERERLDGEISALDRQGEAHAANRHAVRSLLAYVREKAQNIAMMESGERRRLLEELGVEVEAGRPDEERPWLVSAITWRAPAAVVGRIMERDAKQERREWARRDAEEAGVMSTPSFSRRFDAGPASADLVFTIMRRAA